METPILDLKFLYDLSGNDAAYISQVIQIFLENVPDGIVKLEQLILDTEDHYAIERQAHLLKSSAGVVRIKNMHADLAQLEQLAKHHAGRAEMAPLLERVIADFNEALPLLIAEDKKGHK